VRHIDLFEDWITLSDRWDDEGQKKNAEQKATCE